jgi:hypothetical protein
MIDGGRVQVNEENPNVKIQMSNEGCGPFLKDRIPSFDIFNLAFGIQ